MRLPAADTIIFLDLPRTVWTYRVLKRMLSDHGETRPDMGSGCEERFDPKFLKSVWNYPKSQRPAIRQHLHKLESEKDIIILRSRAEVRRFVANQLEANP